ncbi:MAG: hypothetical protein IID53_15330 [Proteobacteria bacterium]|nr:hypothetical protein [Pseudomonadota bacterium]
MFRLARAGLVSILLITLVTSCMSPKGNTVADKRQAAQSMRSETLAQLYEVHPYAKTQIDQAVGYGVFSNVGINLFLFSTASGWGIVRDKKTGQDTYMKMYSVGIGPGLGVKDFRGVFVFTSESALKQFVEDGWDASAQADAVAKAEDKGDAWAGAVDVAPGIKLYQLTQIGLALQATIQGTKFWKDDELTGTVPSN